MEEKLNAVLERQISMDAGKRINDAIAEKTKQSSNKRSADLSEKSPVKASSTGDIKKNFESSSREDLGKSNSEGSSRNDSLHNITGEYEEKSTNDMRTPEEPSHESYLQQRSRDRRGSGSAVNVSVITSTPHRSKSVSRSGSRDNIVVITGKFIHKKIGFYISKLHYL